MDNNEKDKVRKDMSNLLLMMAKEVPEMRPGFAAGTAKALVETANLFSTIEPAHLEFFETLIKQGVLRQDTGNTPADVEVMERLLLNLIDLSRQVRATMIAHNELMATNDTKRNGGH